MRRFSHNDTDGAPIYEYTQGTTDPDYIKDSQAGMVEEYNPVVSAQVQLQAPQSKAQAQSGQAINKGLEALSGGLDTIGQGLETGGKWLAQNIVPRGVDWSQKYLQELGAGNLYGGPRAGVGDIAGTAAGPLGMTTKFLLDKAQGNEQNTWTGRQLPAAAELASMALPAGAYAKYGGKMVPWLTRYGVPAAASGITGLFHGITTPDVSVEEAAKRAGAEGAIATGTSLALSGLTDVGRKVGEGLKGLGRFIGGKRIKPNVASGMNWPTEYEKTIDTMLSDTGMAVTPEGIAKKSGQKFFDIQAQIIRNMRERGDWTLLPETDIMPYVLEKIKKSGLDPNNPQVGSAIISISKDIEKNLSKELINPSTAVTQQYVKDYAAWKARDQAGRQAFDTAQSRAQKAVEKQLGKTAQRAGYVNESEILRDQAAAEELANKLSAKIKAAQYKFDAGRMKREKFLDVVEPLKLELKDITTRIKGLEKLIPEPLIGGLDEGAPKVFTPPPEAYTPPPQPARPMPLSVEHMAPETLYRQKQQMATKLESLGVFDKIADKQPLTMEESGLYRGWQGIKDAIDQAVPETSYLNKVQQRLYNISQGAKKATMRGGTGGMSMINLRDVPILDILPAGADAVSMAIAKMLHAGGRGLQGVAESPFMRALLLGGKQAQSSAEMSRPAEEPLQQSGVQDRNAMLQSLLQQGGY